jgi:two-component system sensor histidine kinase MprB
MSLRSRLAIFIAATVGIAVAGMAVIAYNFASDEARTEIDEFLRGRGPVVGLVGTVEFDEYRSRGGRGPGPSGSGILNALDEIIREDAVAQFVEANGNVAVLGFGEVVLPVDQRDLEIAASGGADYFRDVEVDGVHYRMLTRPLIGGVAIQVGRDVTATDEILAGLRLRLSLFGAGGVVAAAGLAWLVAGRGLRPVRTLTAAAEEVADTRRLEARIEVDRGDELGRLAAAFNDMLVALEESRMSQQRLVADASHELRTPLTSVRTNIELLAKGTVPEDERDELLSDLTAEVAELSHLVAEIVDLATIGREEEPRQDVNLAAIVEQAVDRARRRTGADITFDAEDCVIAGRPTSLLRAVNNLLENAVKWGGDAGPITAVLSGGRLSVRDRGPGIPADDLGSVFQRFYRSPEARALPGSGLGLAIVAAVASDHDGLVFAENHPEGGAVVGFEVACA